MATLKALNACNIHIKFYTGTAIWPLGANGLMGGHCLVSGADVVTLLMV